MVHALASTQILEPNDMVLLDFCRYPQFLGYRLGFSRMVSLRQPTRRNRDDAPHHGGICAIPVRSEARREGGGAGPDRPRIPRQAWIGRKPSCTAPAAAWGSRAVERPEIGAGDDPASAGHGGDRRAQHLFPALRRARGGQLPDHSGRPRSADAVSTRAHRRGALKIGRSPGRA